MGSLKTKDLFLSAYLLSSDVSLQDIAIEDSDRVVFSFLDTGKIDELNREYRIYCFILYNRSVTLCSLWFDGVLREHQQFACRCFHLQEVHAGAPATG